MSPSAPRLDAKGFLCGLSAAPRYTTDQRIEAHHRIAIELAKLGIAPKFHGYDTRSRIGPGVNIYGELPATVQTFEWIVVGAHYDSVEGAPGADDDASGVTAVLMVAETLANLKDRRVNVLFAFFDQEEYGAIGSDHFAEQCRKEHRRIVAVHCIDMVGWDGDKDRVVELALGTANPSPAQNQMVQQYRRAAAGLVGSIMTSSMGRSDHVSFLEYDYPALLVAQEFAGGDSNPNYHRPSDTCDKIDYDYLRRVATLVTRVVTEQVR
jgi:Zn-dependent M28 family amino/carboxypeptidase